MRNMLFRAAIAAGLVIGGSAFAQVRQSGNVTGGHVAQWTTSGVIQDGGTATNGSLTAVGITNTGTPFCINDALTTSASGYHQICFGANSLGGGLLSYNAYGGASSLPFQVNINGSTTTLGTGTVGSGTLGQLPWYNATGNGIVGNANLNVSNGALTIGQAGSVLGSLNLTGNTSGTVSIIPQAAAGTFNFNLPTSAGTVGQVLVSGGGGSTPMSWTTFGGTVSSGSAGQFTYYGSTGTTVSGSSVLTVSGTTLTTSGALVIGGATTASSGAFTASPANAAVTLSPTGTGTVTVNPSTLGTIDNMTVGGTTKAAGSFTTLLATGQISSGVAGSSLGSLALSGNTSGTVTLKTQAAAGSYNFNLPTTAGTSGTPLLSGGGGAAAMTYGSLSGNTATFATASGSLTSGHAAVFDASGNIIDGGTLPVGTINSGTAGRFAYYAGSGTTISDNANLSISSGAVTIGVAGSTAGSLKFTGSSTGTITMAGSGTTIGTYNFNLPTTAGTANQPLLSGGGGASAMAWGTVTGNTTKFPTFTGSTTNGNCVAMDVSGNLIDNGTPCGSGGSGTVTSSTAGQIAYYASSTNAVAGNSSLTISGGALTVGVSTTTTGTVGLSGATSGKVTIQPQAAAGTYNFNLPTTAGSAGQVLVSQGGGSTAMTWGSAGLTAITSQTTSFSPSSNAQYCIDTTGGAVTATLPASPANNDTILFVACSNYSTNNLIIGRAGNNIQGVAQDMTVATNNAAFYLIFVTSYGWRMF